MKKISIASFLVLLISILSIEKTSAQTTVMLHSKATDNQVIFEKDLNATGFIANAGALPLNSVSSKAIRTFDRHFKKVSNLQWYGLNKNKFLATFTNNDGRDSRTLIDKNGFIYYAINYGYAESLSKEQRKNLRSHYIEYEIERVCEVYSGGIRAWVITLQDDEKVVIVRLSEDGNLDELERHNKYLLRKGKEKAGSSFAQKNKKG